MYQQHTLNNGLQLIMVPLDSFQSVSIALFIKIGSRYESAALSGASHFIEHMLFRGTTRRPNSRIIAETIEGIGGMSNAYTGAETTGYYAKVAATQVETALDVLIDLVRNPLFRVEDIEKERSIIGEEISMVYDTPDSWIDVLIDAVIWPDHPLGQSVAGSRESLAGLDRQTLLEFFTAAYHPENVLVAIGGAFDPVQITATIERLLGDWLPGQKLCFEPAPAPQSAARCHIEDRPIEQGHLCLALPGLSRRDPDRYALSLLNTILGDGMSSRLFLEIREEQGLAYAIESGLNFFLDTGSTIIYAGVDAGRASQALKAILRELTRLRDEPVPAEELRKAKEYLKGRLVLGLEDSYSQAAWVAYQVLFADQVQSPEAALAKYEAITAADIQAVARRIVNPAAYNLAAVGPFGPGDALRRLILG